VVTPSKAKVGWIGLGKMGLPMAQRLIAEGFLLTAYNRSAGPVQKLCALGAQAASSPKDLGDMDTVFTMVADDVALRSVAIGDQGCYDQLRPGAVHIDMSTVSPVLSGELAIAARARGILYLRAPVSGSIAAAASGSLIVLASGDEKAYEAAKPLLELLGKKHHYLGDGDQARYLKLAINLMLAVTAAMFGEAMALASKGQVDWRQAVAVMNDSVIASPLIGYKAHMVAERDFTPMFTVSQMAKDLDLALAAAHEVHVAAPVLALVREGFLALKAQGNSELDFFSYVSFVESLANDSSILPR